MLNTEIFSDWAKESGFSQIGFCAIDPFIRSYEIVQDQEPLGERKQLRFFPADDWPEAKSIAILLWPYMQAWCPENGEVFVDSYYAASNAAYHAACALETRVRESGCFVKANVSYPAKEAALRAQMGWIGHHSLLITPSYGSRVVIILMATGIEVPPDHPVSELKTCLKCGRCAKACPSGAIDDKGFTHPERCLRNFTMEGIVVPTQTRSQIGNRLIGCDLCQRVCPMQPKTSLSRRNAYHLREFVTDDPSAFNSAVAKLSEEIGRNAARPQRVRAQAALLAGNSKDRMYLPVLRQWAQLPFEAVHQHAQWAVEQIESDHT